MAKKLVARIRFDDGTNKGENGKSSDYEVGDLYKGEGDIAQLVKNGFLCTEKELEVKEVIDERDGVIKGLESKVKSQAKKIKDLEAKIEELSQKQK